MEAAPYRVQHLLDRALWDADAARDRVREYALEALSHPESVLIVDQTGFLKKGIYSVAVKRQYTGTAGRIENSQVGVFLCYASDRGAALLDRELYLPKSGPPMPTDALHIIRNGIPSALCRPEVRTCGHPFPFAMKSSTCAEIP